MNHSKYPFVDFSAYIDNPQQTSYLIFSLTNSQICQGYSFSPGTANVKVPITKLETPIIDQGVKDLPQKQLMQLAWKSCLMRHDFHI